MTERIDTADFLESLLKQGPTLKIIAAGLTKTIGDFTKMPVQIGKPYIQREPLKQDNAVCGAVRIEGKGLTVELYLGLSKDVFLKIYENMFQMQEEAVTEENQDLAGEVLNIAFGAMDPEFTKLGLKLRASFPKVFSGEKMDAFLKEIKGTAIVLPYICGKHTFTVQIYAENSISAEWTFTAHKQKVA